MDHRTRGEFNYVTPILLISLIVGGWALYNLIPAYYSEARFEADLTNIIYSNSRTAPEEVIEKMRVHFGEMKEIEFKTEELGFSRNEDNPNLVHAEISYRYLVRVPYTEKIFKFPFKAAADKDLSLQNSFR